MDKPVKLQGKLAGGPWSLPVQKTEGKFKKVDITDGLKVSLAATYKGLLDIDVLQGGTLNLQEGVFPLKDYKSDDDRLYHLYKAYKDANGKPFKKVAGKMRIHTGGKVHMTDMTSNEFKTFHVKEGDAAYVGPVPGHFDKVTIGPYGELYIRLDNYFDPTTITSILHHDGHQVYIDDHSDGKSAVEAYKIEGMEGGQLIMNGEQFVAILKEDKKAPSPAPKDHHYPKNTKDKNGFLKPSVVKAEHIAKKVDKIAKVVKKATKKVKKVAKKSKAGKAKTNGESKDDKYTRCGALVSDAEVLQCLRAGKLALLMI